MLLLAYFAVIALGFFLVFVRPQRRRRAAHRALIESLGVGDEIITIGGMFGTIRAIDDDRIELEVSPGVVVSLARAAIAQSAKPPPEPDLGEHPADNGVSDD